MDKYFSMIGWFTAKGAIPNGLLRLPSLGVDLVQGHGAAVFMQTAEVEHSSICPPDSASMTIGYSCWLNKHMLDVSWQRTKDAFAIMLLQKLQKDGSYNQKAVFQRNESSVGQATVLACCVITVFCCLLFWEGCRVTCMCAVLVIMIGQGMDVYGISLRHAL